MTQSKIIRSLIGNIPKNTVFVASEMYKNLSVTVSEANYYKVLERMSKEKVLSKLSRGMYYIPRKNEFGVIPLSEDQILYQFTKNNMFIEVGYTLYNRIGLSTQISKKRVLYVNKLNVEQKKINNIHLIRCKFNHKNRSEVKMIEFLEVLQNYNSILDLNHNVFLDYTRKMAFSYNNKTLRSVLTSFQFKKSTLAFLQEILNAYGVTHNVDGYLSKLSKYKIPIWRKTYEFTSQY